MGLDTLRYHCLHKYFGTVHIEYAARLSDQASQLMDWKGDSKRSCYTHSRECAFAASLSCFVTVAYHGSLDVTNMVSSPCLLVLSRRKGFPSVLNSK